VTPQQQLHGDGVAVLTTVVSRQRCVAGRTECQAQSQLKAQMPCEEFRKVNSGNFQIWSANYYVKMLTKPVRHLDSKWCLIST
jgi:hypothetical protein